MIEENNTGGGAIRVRGDNQVIRNSTFKDNLSNSQRGGGAIFIWFGEGLLIDNCVFLQNHQTFEDSNGGGAIHNWDQGFIVENSEFKANHSLDSGGAIHNHTFAIATINNSIFKFNTSQKNGGAISNSHELTVSNSLFHGNEASEFGGAIRNYEKLAVKNSTFVDNNKSYYKNATPTAKPIPMRPLCA